MKKPIVLFFAILSIVCFSCQKEIEIIPEKNPVAEQSAVIYFLDGIKISEEVFLKNYEKYQNVVELGKDENDYEILISNSFTTNQKYFDWGKERGFDFETRLNAFEHLRIYAEENGVIRHYEATQEVLESYTKYTQKYLTQKGLIQDANNRSITHLCDGCTMYPNTPMFTAMPVMPNGWNNRVSRVNSTNVFSLMTVYDKSFFRNPISTIVLAGGQIFCFNGWTAMNNKMSSGFAT